ncbi:MAG TPA: hypothetical protein VM364_00485 [Vicinamibacterales bacterium]|nr:hypothetical protein [Vicinamibacterales bacterium]
MLLFLLTPAPAFLQADRVQSPEASIGFLDELPPIVGMTSAPVQVPDHGAYVARRWRELGLSPRPFGDESRAQSLAFVNRMAHELNALEGTTRWGLLHKDSGNRWMDRSIDFVTYDTGQPQIPHVDILLDADGADGRTGPSWDPGHGTVDRARFRAPFPMDGGATPPPPPPAPACPYPDLRADLAKCTGDLRLALADLERLAGEREALQTGLGQMEQERDQARAERDAVKHQPCVVEGVPGWLRALGVRPRCRPAQ